MKSRQIFRNFLDSLQQKGSEGKRREARDGLKEERMALSGGARGRSHTASGHRARPVTWLKKLSEKPLVVPTHENPE